MAKKDIGEILATNESLYRTIKEYELTEDDKGIKPIHKKQLIEFYEKIMKVPHGDILKEVKNSYFENKWNYPEMQAELYVNGGMNQLHKKICRAADIEYAPKRTSHYQASQENDITVSDIYMHKIEANKKRLHDEINIILKANNCNAGTKSIEFFIKRYFKGMTKQVIAEQDGKGTTPTRVDKFLNKIKKEAREDILNKIDIDNYPMEPGNSNSDKETKKAEKHLQEKYINQMKKIIGKDKLAYTDDIRYQMKYDEYGRLNNVEEMYENLVLMFETLQEWCKGMDVNINNNTAIVGISKYILGFGLAKSKDVEEKKEKELNVVTKVILEKLTGKKRESGITESPYMKSRLSMLVDNTDILAELKGAFIKSGYIISNQPMLETNLDIDTTVTKKEISQSNVDLKELSVFDRLYWLAQNYLRDIGVLKKEGKNKAINFYTHQITTGLNMTASAKATEMVPNGAYTAKKQLEGNIIGQGMSIDKVKSGLRGIIIDELWTEKYGEKKSLEEVDENVKEKGIFEGVYELATSYFKDKGIIKKNGEHKGVKFLAHNVATGLNMNASARATDIVPKGACTVKKQLENNIVEHGMNIEDVEDGLRGEIIDYLWHEKYGDVKSLEEAQDILKAAEDIGEEFNQEENIILPDENEVQE